MTSTTRGLALFFLLGTYLNPSATTPINGQRSQEDRRDYEVHDIGALDALIQLGELYDRPMGIISGNQTIAAIKVSARSRQATALEATSALVHQLPGYEWAEVDGVLVVRPHVLPSITNRMLAIVISRITAQNMDIDSLNFRLWMELQLQVDPESRTKGFAGIGHLRHYFDLGQIDLTNVRIDEVLNELVRRKKSAAWVIPPPPETLKGTPREKLWGIVFYSNPPLPLDRLCCLNQDSLR